MNFTEHSNFTTERKLNNKFYVSKLLTSMDIDFLYSFTRETGEYKLLNQDMFGVIDPETIETMLEDNRIIIIDNEDKRFYAFNIPEAEVDNAFMSL